MNADIPVEMTDTSKEERNWAMALHLCELLNLAGAYLGVLAMVAIWVIKRKESKFIDENGKRALNFQITLAVISLGYLALAGVLAFIAENLKHSNYETVGPFLVPMATFLVGMSFVTIAIVLLGHVFAILGAKKANEGGIYKYPYSIRFIK